MASKTASRLLTEKYDSYLKACVSAFQFSGVVLTAHGGKSVWSGAVGFANREHRVLNTERTKFRLASITKQFTSMAIMLLQEQGKLDVNEKIAKYVKQAPKHWKKITLHNLLVHTSGIPCYTGFSDHATTTKNKVTPNDLVARFRDKELEFSPGEKFEYSNSNYVLLGTIIETLSAKTFGEFLQENIFEPLGMKDSGVDANDVIMPDRAAGYVRKGDNQFRNSEYLDMSLPYSAGALYSTARDLMIWNQALTNGTLLSPASTKAMFTPDKDGYAYGWSVKDIAGRTTIGHAGGINGFTTNIERIPSAGFCSIVLSNIEDAPVCLMSNNLRSITFGEPCRLPKKHKAIKPDPRVLEGLEGEYELGPEFIVTVSREGNELTAQATGQGKLHLVPKSATEFFFVEIYAQMTFCRNANNLVTHLILHQNGNNLHAKKLNSKTSRSKRQARTKAH
jgi:D-alanyl-D-alanine carboxypeptidase